MRRMIILLSIIGLMLVAAPTARASQDPSLRSSATTTSAMSTVAVPAATCPKAIHRLLLKAFKVAYTWQQGSAKARARIVPRLVKAKRLASGLVASQITSVVTYLNTGGQDPTAVLEAIAATGESARLGNC